MEQFYFLSVLFNILAGLILVYGRDLTQGDDEADEELELIGEDDGNAGGEKVRGASLFKDFDGFNNATFRLVIGILSTFVGIMKLLAAYDGIPVLGDLLPAFAGIGAGASLLIEYYLLNASDPDTLPEGLQSVFIDSRKYIGVLCLVVGLLHFIFPRVLVL
ncbi:MAG: hypothetical protein II187_08280 [Treponema sp.]|nr:hypothetical protein [Treponema sp.]